MKDSDATYLYKGQYRSRPTIEYRNVLQEKPTTHLITKDMTFWDAAGWKGCTVYADATTPLALGLMFENEEKGRAIFEEWKRKYTDATLPIRIVVLKGIDAKDPLSYRLSVMSDLSMLRNVLDKNQRITFVGRNLTMQPKSNQHIQFLERGFLRFGHCRLVPMFLDPHGQIKTPIDFSVSFDFSRLTIMDAWKVEANSENLCALSPDDTPLIPEDRKHDAPVLKALEQLRSFSRARDNDASERMEP